MATRLCWHGSRAGFRLYSRLDLRTLSVGILRPQSNLRQRVEGIHSRIGCDTWCQQHTRYCACHEHIDANLFCGELPHSNG